MAEPRQRGMNLRKRQNPGYRSPGRQSCQMVEDDQRGTSQRQECQKGGDLDDQTGDRGGLHDRHGLQSRRDLQIHRHGH
ncbi:hypothetical protein N7488_000578 [Penicillium malachiteum]|nr:hypothetical protein N7488_000578 [Penicillium malachiteum]